MMKRYAVIPARYESSRFPGKPLALLNGKPVLRHVYERVLSSELFDEVIIATDDLRISAVAQDFGATVVLTSEDLPSGTDRIAAVAEVLEPDSLILNVQGDEPLINKAALQTLLSAFDDPDVKMASLMTLITDIEELKNPNIVKVVTDAQGDAMYFSRSLIPFDRDHEALPEYYRHIGVYGFKHSALMQFVKFPLGVYEQIEKLEQLRALENGLKIRMCKTDYQGFGVDTPQDLEKLSHLIL
ncbi:MAG: 3-deoxy-manno-octulosonate cytidylyltransferase [Candidatus Cloacimonetes bacterium]|jgi:3-deoxy-manno-octulosonate cytidylyltransferase (CMP-KDO synthetase)|nr:3-deoxy-manno-octulosonate cytidylyltransferase [Candidatus Cloacimonadota bacterium]MDD3562539.1 3-deoxy-manno-octulosonate cytidylyltransferase [Candidatus Cloacimonadota bacterium]